MARTAIYLPAIADAIVWYYRAGKWENYWHDIAIYMDQASDAAWNQLIARLDADDEARGEPPSVPVTASGLHCARKNR